MMMGPLQTQRVQLFWSRLVLHMALLTVCHNEYSDRRMALPAHLQKHSTGQWKSLEQLIRTQEYRQPQNAELVLPCGKYRKDEMTP